MNGRSIFGNGGIYTKGIKTATIFIAASDSSNKAKRNADYICDGVADEVEIKAAIDALPSTGGEIILLAGTFNIADDIVIDTNDVTLSGAGWSTILKHPDELKELLSSAAASGQADIIVADGSVFFVGQNVIILDDNGWEERIVSSVSSNTVTVTVNLAYSYATVDNAVLMDTHNIIRVTGCTGTIIKDIKLDGNQSNISNTLASASFSHGEENDVWRVPVIVTGNVSDTTIQDCWFAEYEVNGLLVWATNLNNKVRVLGNKFTTSADNEQTRGIALESSTSYSIVANNHIVGGHVGMYLNGGDNYTVTGNLIDLGDFSDSTTRRGIYLVNGDYSTISGNSIINASKGVEIQTSDFVSFVGNSIINSTRGLYFDGAGGSNKCMIVGNIIAGEQWYAIDCNPSYPPTNSIIAYNIVSNTNVSGKSDRAGIDIRDTTTLVHNNWIADTTVWDTLIFTQPGMIIKGNVNFVTENEGGAAAVADGGTIAHGLVGTPNSVRVTGTVAAEIISVTAIDATNLTVAIKKDDGTAGTSQTIYWEAKYVP